MPKKRAYGFVYLHEHDQGEPVAKTIAHELGHGLFRLEHTFEAYPALTKGSTNNLMDYGRGTRLHKYQWDLVHNPEAMLGWFQEEQESASYGDPYAYLWKEINALTSGISYSLYQFNEWVAASRRSILSLFDFSDVDLTSDEEKVYEILTAMKEGNLESLSDYAAEQIIVGQDLQLGEDSYEKLIVHFLQAPAAIDTDYGTEDEAEKGYSLLIFGEEGKIDQEVLKVQVASEQKEALVAYLFGIQEEPVVKEEEVAGDTIYTFFVTNDDAWYREKEAPYKTITPVPATDILAQGVQVSVLEVVKDNKNRDVAKMKLKSTDSIAYTSLGNLSEVKAMSKELTYKMTKDYTAVKLPYSSESTDKTYKKDTEFTAYKRCGDYVKVKGQGGSIEGHWIEKSAARATEPEFPVTTEQIAEIFPDTNEERIEEVVEAINSFSNEFEINTTERMAHFLGQIGAETGGLKKLNEGDSYTAKRIYQIFLKPNLRSNSSSTSGKTFKYCDLVDGYSCANFTSCPTNGYQGHDDCATAINVELDSDGSCKWKYVNFDSTYDVKSSYMSSSTLFDYVYGCRMENGAKSTKDGSTYRGKGFIHLTGKENYRRVSEKWNERYPNDEKKFHENDIDLLETDVEVAIKASMVFWKWKGLNEKADEGDTDEHIDNVGKIVNGSGKRKPHGYKDRRKHTKKAYEIFGDN